MKRFLAAPFLVLCFSLATHAQTPSPSPAAESQTTAERPPVSPDLKLNLPSAAPIERVGVDASNQWTLTLEAAIKLALENNNDIDASKLNSEISKLSLRAARAGFDPNLVSDSFYENRSTPTASVIGGARDGLVTLKTTSGSVGVSGLSRFAGGRYGVSFSSSRTNTSNSNATLNPQFPTFLSFSYTQPLLRGRTFDFSRRTLEIAKKNVALSDTQFELSTMRVVSQVEQAYWDLVFAIRNLDVQNDAVKQSRLQLESNQRLVEKGVLAPIETVAASAQISTLEQAVFSAQAAVTAAENNLKTLLLSERSDIGWSRAIVPVSPVDLGVPRTPLEEAVKAALSSRPEITASDTEGEIAKINEKYFRNQTKMQVDLTGSYSATSLAGGLTAASINPSNGQLRVPERFIGGWSTSLGSLVTNDYPTYRVGLTVTLPFGNRAAKANLGAALVEADIVRNERAQIEQLIEAEVRNSLQNLRSAEARLQAATASRASAEQLYESEQRQFRNGTTTMFLVFQRQNELVAARGRELQARTDLNKAISVFQRVTGSTLKANNIEISK